jgi:polar amino acid transport system substrate-binding protein
VYTSDSSVCTAAVHVGLITLVQGGTATIEIRPGQDSYTGSDRNGIHSAQYGPWDASYVFVDSSGVAIVGVDAQPSAGASATATFAPTGSPASSGATPGATVTALDADLLTPGQLAICMPFDRLLFAERDSDGKPFGVDVEIGLAIAEQLALTPEFVEVAFEDLIPAILDSECDVTIGGQFITAARLALIDMVPYREGTQHVVVKAGNPLAIERLTDLCGRSVAIVQGTIHAEILGGISDDCTASGQSAVVIATYPSEAEAENALASGETDAYIGNDFVTVERPADFERSAELPKLRNGIGHQVNLPTLDEAIRDALRTIIGNGAYDAILEKYGVTQVRLTELP